MPTNFSKGRNLEYAAWDRLRTLGYTVFRCAGSRPIDLVAIKNGRIALVECKTGLNPYLSPTQLSHILELAKRINATVIVAVRKKHRGIRWLGARENGIRETQLE